MDRPQEPNPRRRAGVKAGILCGRHSQVLFVGGTPRVTPGSKAGSCTLLLCLRPPWELRPASSCHRWGCTGAVGPWQHPGPDPCSWCPWGVPRVPQRSRGIVPVGHSRGMTPSWWGIPGASTPSWWGFWGGSSRSGAQGLTGLSPQLAAPSRRTATRTSASTARARTMTSTGSSSAVT